MKVIDAKQSIYDLIQTDEKIKDYLFELGFKDITKPGMLSSVGRFMTLKMGCQLKKIPFEEVYTYFLEKGYQIKE